MHFKRGNSLWGQRFAFASCFFILLKKNPWGPNRANFFSKLLGPVCPLLVYEKDFAPIFCLSRNFYVGF